MKVSRITLGFLGFAALALLLLPWVIVASDRHRWIATTFIDLTFFVGISTLSALTLVTIFRPNWLAKAGEELSEKERAASKRAGARLLVIVLLQLVVAKLLNVF